MLPVQANCYEFSLHKVIPDWYVYFGGEYMDPERRYSGYNG